MIVDIEYIASFLGLSTVIGGTIFSVRKTCRIVDDHEKRIRSVELAVASMEPTIKATHDSVTRIENKMFKGRQ